MKTEKEAALIQEMAVKALPTINAVREFAGYAEITKAIYDNDTETIILESADGTEYINVHLSSVSASLKDLINQVRT